MVTNNNNNNENYNNINNSNNNHNSNNDNNNNNNAKPQLSEGWQNFETNFLTTLKLDTISH